MPGKRLAGPRVSVKELAQSLHGAVPDFQGPTLIEFTPQGQYEGVTKTTFENPQTFKVCHAVVSRWGGRAIKKTTCISAIDLATSETYWNINLGPHFGEHEGGKLHICLMYLWNSYVRAHHSRHAKLNELKAILATAHPQAPQRYAKWKRGQHRWKRGNSYCIDAVVCPQPIPDYPAPVCAQPIPEYPDLEPLDVESQKEALEQSVVGSSGSCLSCDSIPQKMHVHTPSHKSMGEDTLQWGKDLPEKSDNAEAVKMMVDQLRQCENDNARFKLLDQIDDLDFLTAVQESFLDAGNSGSASNHSETTPTTAKKHDVEDNSGSAIATPLIEIPDDPSDDDLKCPLDEASLHMMAHEADLVPAEHRAAVKKARAQAIKQKKGQTTYFEHNNRKIRITRKMERKAVIYQIGNSMVDGLTFESTYEHYL